MSCRPFNLRQGTYLVGFDALYLPLATFTTYSILAFERRGVLRLFILAQRGRQSIVIFVCRDLDTVIIFFSDDEFLPVGPALGSKFLSICRPLRVVIESSTLESRTFAWTNRCLLHMFCWYRFWRLEHWNVPCLGRISWRSTQDDKKALTCGNILRYFDTTT